MVDKSLFNVELIDLNLSAETEEELFHVVSDRLLSKGLVNSGYLNGIIEREKQFATGLITQHLNIALPHSDTKYIEKPFVYIVRLNNPVTVKQMGDNQIMDTKDLLFLGIKEPTKQVGLLAGLMELFMNEDFVNEYINTESEQDLYELIIKNI